VSANHVAYWDGSNWISLNCPQGERCTTVQSFGPTSSFFIRFSKPATQSLVAAIYDNQMWTSTCGTLTPCDNPYDFYYGFDIIPTTTTYSSRVLNTNIGSFTLDCDATLNIMYVLVVGKNTIQNNNIGITSTVNVHVTDTASTCSSNGTCPGTPCANAPSVVTTGLETYCCPVGIISFVLSNWVCTDPESTSNYAAINPYISTECPATTLSATTTMPPTTTAPSSSFPECNAARVFSLSTLGTFRYQCRLVGDVTGNTRQYTATVRISGSGTGGSFQFGITEKDMTTFIDGGQTVATSGNWGVVSTKSTPKTLYWSKVIDYYVRVDTVVSTGSVTFTPSQEKITVTADCSSGSCVNNACVYPTTCDADASPISLIPYCTGLVHTPCITSCCSATTNPPTSDGNVLALTCSLFIITLSVILV